MEGCEAAGSDEMHVSDDVIRRDWGGADSAHDVTLSFHQEAY